MASVKKTSTKAGETRYRVRYRDPNGDDREKWFRRSVDAERYKRNVETDMDRGTYIDPAAQRTTFGEMAMRWQLTREDRAASTLDRDASYLRSLILPEFGRDRLPMIKPSKIEAWVSNMKKASSTRGKALQILKSVLELARRDGLILMNPAADVKPPPKTSQQTGRALTDDEMNAIIGAAEDVDERTAVVVHLAARCGLRIGEAIALRRRDVDLDGATIAVRTSMPRRGQARPVKGRLSEDEGRVIPIPDDVVRRLRRHFAERPVASIDDFVVTAPRGGPLRYPNWRNRVWIKIIDRVNFDATSHDLRRTAATRLFAEDRWTPAEVQTYLGHRDPRVTLGIYALVRAETLPKPSEFSTGIG